MIDTRAEICRDNPLKLPRLQLISEFLVGSWVRRRDDEQPQMVIDRTVGPSCPQLIDLNGTIHHPRPDEQYLGLDCVLRIKGDVRLPA